MQHYKKYYEENLYTLQDGILKCVKNLDLPFYLTGGTALSRGYFQHRYSDDIDLFSNSNPDFKSNSQNILTAISEIGYTIDSSSIIVLNDYISFFVTHQDFQGVTLKVDLVNDVAPYFGTIVETSVYYRTDDWYNILINKITALLRLEIKDLVDVWIIAKNKAFNWDEIITKARQKELGLDPIMCAETMKTVPFEEFDTIKWAIPVSYEEFKKDMDIITIDFLKGCDNSLV